MGARLPWTAAAAVLLVAAWVGAAAAAPLPKGKAARITLQAKWEGTPLLHEAAEFLSVEDPALFWKFVEGWQGGADGLPPDATPARCWAGIRAAAAEHLSAPMARLFDASLAARQYSARLEMFRQLAAEGGNAGAGADAADSPAAGARRPCCFALLRGTAYSEPAALKAALEAALASGDSDGTEGGAGAVYPFDHVYASPAAAGAPPLNATASHGTLPVELFAPIGSPCAAQLHDVLSKAAEASDAAAAAAAARGARAAPPRRLAYAWRPLLEAGACGAQAHPCTRLGTGERLVLPGYGVELALKNMEYNAQDDSKQAGSDKAGEEEGDEEAAEEAGAAAGEQEGGGGEGPLQIKLKNLGLQAAQRVLNAANASAGLGDPLAAVQELAQDFPRLAQHLSQHKYGKSLRTATEALQRYVPAGAQFLALNGLLLEAKDLSLYDLLDAVRREIRLHDALAAAGLPPAQLREAQLLRGAAAGSDEPPRLRLAPEDDDAIAWVNDLEQDEKYMHWPPDLNSLLMPMYPGRLPSIRRNVLQAVYLFDPASPAALDICALVFQIELQSWPLRMGLVPVVPSRVARARGDAGAMRAGDAPSLSERMGRLLALIQHTFTVSEVTQFLFELRAAVPPEQDGQPGFPDRLWEEAARVLEEQWEGFGADSDTLTAEQALALAAAPGDGAGAEGADPAALKHLDSAARLALSSGLAGMARGGVLVLNGLVHTNDAGSGWQGLTMGALQPALQAVQEDVYMQRLRDSAADVQEEILRLHGSVSRYNPRIMPLDSGAPGFLRISGESEEYAARQLVLTGPLLGPAATARHAGTPDGAGLWVRYYGPEASLLDDEDASAARMASVTHWVVADVTQKQGLALVAAALQHRSAAGRVAVVVNAAGAGVPEEDPSSGRLRPIERLVVAAASGLFETDPIDLTEQLDAVLQLPQAPGELSLAQIEGAIGFGGHLAQALDSLAGKLPAAAASHARFVRSALGLPPGASAVVTNGRLVELPLPAEGSRANADFEPRDFELLELYAQRQQYSSAVAELVRGAHEAGALQAADLSAVAAAVSSALAAAKPEEADPRSGRVVELIAKHAEQRNFVRLPADAPAGGDAGEGAQAPLLIHAILNPLSKPAQRLAPLLRFVRAAVGAEVQLLLNPERDLDSMPLKTFYRYALPTLPSADAAPGGAAAAFTGLPGGKVLTLGMDEPEAWLVEPVRAQHDLDNLRLDELTAPPGGTAAGEPVMEATFELEALLLTGMCLDLASLQARMRDQIHPRGVQLQLLPASAPEGAPPLVDTLVMSNLGYFQLKSRPGLWKLKLAPGRSQELYTVASSTGASSSGQRAEAAVAGADAHSVPVALASFSGKHMHLFLRKHADRLHEDVLEAVNATTTEEEGGDVGAGLLGKVASLVGGGKGGPALAAQREGAEDDRVHVFTVASGHMYERLQKIMILSAIKRTSARLKFWFIKNYMSPQMKAFVPYMAKKYNFDYEFVTYKWPSWLHKQTEKQRIIWAYKILFLDVLFPLNLKKVIFCDSDQVVRADLTELWRMDLQGAPYGYTPFCDNNAEMEGFRFWKQGFWKDHLQGKPYHISALYVIDLERFRQMAAGDRLRVIYEGLSKDPNSLANLDQDLPNYAQHGVPIFSLPQQWLWCETWCGTQTRAEAKTIDLCNNPLTKEPKLQSARRIIAEWPFLNREAEEFTAAVERVQRGELSEAQLLSDESAFHVRLAPMVEGVVWASEEGELAGKLSESGGAAHDASEL